MSRKRIRVEVTWLDAAAVTQAWVPLADAVSKDGRALVCIHSIGYLIRFDKKVLVLAADAHDERVGRVQIIPQRLIVKRRRLR
jgi:esterase/lipase superfamily enzyme